MFVFGCDCLWCGGGCVSVVVVVVGVVVVVVLVLVRLVYCIVIYGFWSCVS